MITHIPYESLGQADFGWLQARHHFSFGRYMNPNRMHFGALRVVNDDIVQAGTGFGTHPHDNMEIITYVRQGEITHRDSLNHEGTTSAGNVQVMSAGTGIAHSEHNTSQQAMRMYQIWIIPHTQNVSPRWEAREFPHTPVTEMLNVLVSGRSEHANQQPLFIHQDAAIYAGTAQAGTILNNAIKYQAYLLVSKGVIEIEDVKIKAGDGAEITATKQVQIKIIEDAELLLIDVPEIT
jgi:quercetin 2,3-dioxygenase